MRVARERLPSIVAMNEPIAYPQAAQHAVFFGAGRRVRQGGWPTTRVRTDDLPAGRYDRRGGRR